VSAAARRAAQTWTDLLAVAAGVFTRPSFAIFCDLVTGWVLTPGRRTITRMIQIVDPDERRAHDAYHRFVRAGVWSMAALWRVLTVTVIDGLTPAGRIVCDVDDTVFKKTGRRIVGAGIFRDAVRSTRNRVVYAFGLNLVVITLRVIPPWGGVPIGLPINMRVRAKNGTKTTVDLAAEMMTEIAGWLPDRQFTLCGDGAYASLAGAKLPRTHVVSRIRRDAALYELTPPPTGRRGRPRKKGERLGAPTKLATTATGWTTVTIDCRGTTIVRQIWSRRLLWYSVCRDTPVLLVIVRDPTGKQPDDYYFTTDIDADPAEVATTYLGRWAIEITFRDVKQHLGGEDPQTWTHRGPHRAAALSLWIYTAIWAWYIPTYGTRRTWRPTPWYLRKTTPSFADALAALRRLLWHRITSVWSTQPHPTKMLGPMIDALAYAA
jgi:hypothetical protein